MNKFGEFAANEIFDGDKISIGEVLDKEIIVKNFKVSGSKYKNNDCLTLHVTIDGENRVIFTGSSVLLDQVQQHKDKLPFVSTIKKFNKYYTFT